MQLLTKAVVGGAVLAGLVLPSLAPAGRRREAVEPARSVTSSAPASFDPAWTIARVWNETLLDAIRIDRPKPPAHARNLFHTSAAMWDAWAAYDPHARGYLVTEKHVAGDVEAARRQAISHAVFRLLMHRFPGGGIDGTDFQPCQPGAATSQTDFVATMRALGYDPDERSTAGDWPAALGNRIGQTYVDHGLTDGANEGEDLCYPGFVPYRQTNPELVFELPGTEVFDPNRWQPLAFDFLILQNGIVIGTALQSFVGFGWANVTPFALTSGDRRPPGGGPAECTSYPGAPRPYLDPGCPPQLGGVGDAALRDAVVELIAFGAAVDPGDGELVDLSPSSYGHHPLGTDDGTGHAGNPFTCEAYPPHVMSRADYARVIAEFWADGPDSETPPGHWNTLAHYLTSHPALGEKRLGGPDGPLLDDLEWDVKLLFALNGAEHDAAIGAWGAKLAYDSSRPITLIRHMGGRGQSSDPALSSYDPEGLPLVPGLIELVTGESAAPGGRHEHLAAFCDGGFRIGEPCRVEADCPDDGVLRGSCRSAVGEIAVRGWRGSPSDPRGGIGGVGWIRAVDWIPYQADTFVTPPFPGYTSGHSTFSRAGAEVFEAFTGTPFFPGGLGTFVAEKDGFLRFELGPTETVELQWATFRDAADEAGLSRRYGGIHPWYDDYPGRAMGSVIGRRAFEKALGYFRQTPGSGWLDPGGCLARVEVCHGTGRGGRRSLEISRHALPAHLGHGDLPGSCDEDGPPRRRKDPRDPAKKRPPSPAR